MVKKALLLFLICSISFADILDEKIKSFIDERKYRLHSKLIDRIFENRDEFIYQNRVDILKVTEKLKENGLLSLFYAEPLELEVLFETRSSPAIFMHLIGQSLKRLGYYYFNTKHVNYEDGLYSWVVILESEHAIDPTIFIKDLRYRGVVALDVMLKSKTDWVYKLEIEEPILLDSIEVLADEEVELRRSLDAHWLTFKDGDSGTLRVRSLHGNSWYPYVVLYDKNLNIIKIDSVDRVSSEYRVEILDEVKFVKIGDLYTDINIKNGLKIHFFKDLN